MKKILISILGILIGFVSFGFCEDYILDVPRNPNRGGSSNFSNTYLDILLTDTGLYSFDSIYGYSRFEPYLTYSFYDLYTNEFLFSGDFISLGSGYYSFNTFSSINSLEHTGIRLYLYFTPGRYFVVGLSPIDGTGISIIDTLDHDFFAQGYYFYTIMNLSYSINSIFSPNKLNILDDNGNNIKSIEVDNGGTIELFINSPVVQNSNNIYTYDGATGINLFYNNTNIFYDKNKLFLVGQFRYNKNVFTPICL